MVIVKRNSIYAVLCFLTISCNIKSTPKCGDPEVKTMAIELFNKEIREKLEEQYLDENFNRYDAFEYAKNKGWDENDYADQQKKKIVLEAKKYAEKVLSKTDVINIRSNSIEEKIKLCRCTAEILNEGLKKIEIDYSAQKTEDKDNTLYVELSYTIK